MHKVCICILGAHYFRLHSDKHVKCACSMHIVCKCVLIDTFVPSLLGARKICICRLCRLYAHYLSCTKKKWAISLHIVRKSRCAASLHLVCMLKVFTKCLHSLHKVCICFHKLIAKCALSVPDADFADLVQTLQTWCNKTQFNY